MRPVKGGLSSPTTKTWGALLVQIFSFNISHFYHCKKAGPLEVSCCYAFRQIHIFYKVIKKDIWYIPPLRHTGEDSHDGRLLAGPEGLVPEVAESLVHLRRNFCRRRDNDKSHNNHFLHYKAVISMVRGTDLPCTLPSSRGRYRGSVGGGGGGRS